VARNDENAIRILYHKSSQIMALAICPLAALMVVDSYAIVFAWTGSPVIAFATAPLVSLLAVGTGLNGLMHLPHALQLAYGWTRIGLLTSVMLVALLVPTIFIVVPRYGARGGAAVWVALNLISVTVTVPLTHRRLLRGEGLKWFKAEVATPIAVAVIAALGLSLAFPPVESRGISIVTIGITLVIVTLLTASSLEWPRAILLSRIRKGENKMMGRRT
jgi:hypothetical protein